MIKEVIIASSGPPGEHHLGRWDNYERIWNDAAFGAAWRHTLMFTVLALVLDTCFRSSSRSCSTSSATRQGYLRIAGIPAGDPPAGGRACCCSKYLYDPSEAGISLPVKQVGLPQSGFTQNPGHDRAVVVIASTWLNMGGACSIYLASLQGIPAASTRRPRSRAPVCCGESGT